MSPVPEPQLEASNISVLRRTVDRYLDLDTRDAKDTRYPFSKMLDSSIPDSLLRLLRLRVIPRSH